MSNILQCFQVFRWEIVSNFKEKFSGIYNHVVQMLIDPTSSVTDIRERHNARLAATISLALILIFTFYMAFLRAPTTTDLISYFMLLGTYVFSRTRFNFISIGLLMLMVSANTFINIWQGTTVNPDQTLYFLSVSYGLAAIYLRRTWMVIFTIGNMLMLSLVPRYAPQGLIPSEHLSVHLTINALLGVTAIVLTTHKGIIEKERLEETRRNAAAALFSLTRALEVRHQDTAGHSNRAVDLTIGLAKRCGITNPRRLRRIREGALLHDIGKIAVPDHILLKPGSLTDEEWVVVKQHPTVGFELIKEFEFFRDATAIPHHHHERYDGSGYPDGLAGEEIPIEARIFAIVDVYDALLEKRPYRDAFPIEKVIEHFEENRGVLYDPVILDKFMDMIGEKDG